MRYSRLMRPRRVVRAGGIAGLSAAAAVVAHAGPAGLADPGWLAVAALGSAVALTALAIAAVSVLTLERRAARVRAGEVPEGGLGAALDAPPLGLLVAATIVCQGAAHGALLAAGVPAHTGSIMSAVLHVLLAVAAAAVVWSVERLVAHAAGSLARAVAAALALLLAQRPPRIPAPAGRRWSQPHAGRVHGRAPPPGRRAFAVIAPA
jgi:hypothetical protein